jgi:hypothetical protein
MRNIVKWFSQILLLIAAFLSGSYSLIDFLHLQVKPNEFHVFWWTLFGEKTVVEFRVRFYVSVIALVAIIVMDILDVYLPARKVKDIRKNYMNLKADLFKEKIKSKDLRISIWYLRRPWYWPFWKTFKLDWKTGFAAPSDKDLKVRLATWQGVSGLAFRLREPKTLPSVISINSLSWPEKWLLMNEHRMAHWQLKKVEAVTGLISIPMLMVRENKPDKAVGVINVDSVTDAGAKHISENFKDLAAFYLDQGKALALLDF